MFDHFALTDTEAAALLDGPSVFDADTAVDLDDDTATEIRNPDLDAAHKALRIGRWAR